MFPGGELVIAPFNQALRQISRSNRFAEAPRHVEGASDFITFVAGIS
jgi:hypothetical protein